MTPSTGLKIGFVGTWDAPVFNVAHCKYTVVFVLNPTILAISSFSLPL